MAVYYTTSFESEGGKNWGVVTWECDGDDPEIDFVHDVYGLPVAHPVSIVDACGRVVIGSAEPVDYDGCESPASVELPTKTPWRFTCLTEGGGKCICKHDRDNPLDFDYVAHWFEPDVLGVRQLYRANK